MPSHGGTLKVVFPMCGFLYWKIWKPCQLRTMLPFLPHDATTHAVTHIMNLRIPEDSDSRITSPSSPPLSVPSQSPTDWNSGVCLKSFYLPLIMRVALQLTARAAAMVLSLGPHEPSPVVLGEHSWCPAHTNSTHCHVATASTQTCATPLQVASCF